MEFPRPGIVQPNFDLSVKFLRRAGGLNTELTVRPECYTIQFEMKKNPRSWL